MSKELPGEQTGTTVTQKSLPLLGVARRYLLSMDDVVVSPHSLCWTEDFARGVSDSALASIMAVTAGQRPANVLSPQVFSSQVWAGKQRR